MAMEANSTKARELQEEFDASNAKLEQISKATKGSGKPMDICAVLSNVERLQKCADEQLSNEGANKFKAIVTDLAKFTTELLDFLPQNLPLPAEANAKGNEDD